jgi:formylglycine-generating enzyme required for sulfatase activity
MFDLNEFSVADARRFCRVLACSILLGAAGVRADSTTPEARFKGVPSGDPAVANIQVDPGTPDYSLVTFDLAWGHSWRTAWEVPEEQHGGKGKLSLENWDAAWVFVKFRKSGADGWSHATLSPLASDHAAPAGAKIDIGLSDDGKRGLGAFVYRSAPGSGPVDWKRVKIRWQHAGDGVGKLAKVVVVPDVVPVLKPDTGTPQEPDEKPDPLDNDAMGALFAAADKASKGAKSDTLEVRVLVIGMVYVPEGAFWVGDGTTNGVAAQFSTGKTTAPFRIASEAAITLGGDAADALGNRDGAGGFDDFSAGTVQALPAPFPKGFAAFYCMKQELTQGQVASFLNTLSSGQQGAMKGLPGGGNNRIGIAEPGTPAVYGTATPYQVCDGLACGESLAYAAWAGLRPMTELEFEKACRGPLKPVAGEFAWGTDKAVGTNSKDTPPDGYALKNAGKPDETVTWVGGNGPDATHGNAAWIGTMVQSDPIHHGGQGLASNAINRPLRAGIFATPQSDRVSAGASYWGIMEMSGNVREPVVTVGTLRGRRFAGLHGDGTQSELSDWHALGEGLKYRGGGFWRGEGKNSLRVSDRSVDGVSKDVMARMVYFASGFRGVRSAGAGSPTAIASQGGGASGVAVASGMFNEKLRIENLTVVPRDASSATVRFDITWDESWRNTTNYDAAWVFFKTKSADGKSWQPVKLAADKVLNPAGYGQEQGGMPLEFLVPDGPDGFNGVFIQRAASGTGPLLAKGVTVVCAFSDTRHSTPDTRHPTPDTLNIQAFGIEMVYVPEGPFYLGSGGCEPNRFYTYTDGSQNTQPYRVPDAGAIPTGPQAGRLWAIGVAPDDSDAGELPAAFPNGYGAFYCMKQFIKQGQFGGFLAMQSEIKSDLHAFRGGNWPVRRIFTQSDGVGLSWMHGAAFAAWAGLRPMTELEYEKACRGPRQPVANEVGPGYWGIQDLNVGAVFGYTISAGSAMGRGFKGSHGRGTPALPSDWPATFAGLMTRGGGLALRTAYDSEWDLVRTSFRLSRVLGAESGDQAFSYDAGAPFAGLRGVRSAPVVTGAEKKSVTGCKVEVDALPNLVHPDIGIFYLSGRFHNAGDKAQKVELTSGLPEACFPEGVASRTFTAEPKSATPFRILTAVTRQNGRVARRGQMLPVQVRIPGGEVLAETSVRLPLMDPMAVVAPVVGSLDGGTVMLQLTNATDKSQTMSVELQPPAGLVVTELRRGVEMPAGIRTQVTFPVRRRDASVGEGFYKMPYRVGVTKEVMQGGDTLAELRNQSSWWIGRRQIPKKGPSLDAADSANATGMDGLDALTKDLAPDAPVDTTWEAPPDLFKLGQPPKNWVSVTNGSSLWLARLKPIPEQDTLVLAATRVMSSSDREVSLKIGCETARWTWLDDTLLASLDWGLSAGPKPFVARILCNGDVVYDGRPGTKEKIKPARLHKGSNTLLVQCHITAEKAEALGNMFVFFYDTKSGERLEDLVFDVEGAGKGN